MLSNKPFGAVFLVAKAQGKLALGAILEKGDQILLTTLFAKFGDFLGDIGVHRSDQL